MRDSARWVALGPAATPAEAAAQAKVRDLLPDAPTTAAWANLMFLDLGGRAWETDILVLTRSGLLLVELKGWHGQVTGNQQSWRIVNGERVETRPNPTLLGHSKAQRLKALLDHHNRKRPGSFQALPYVRAVTVMHGDGSSFALDDASAANTYALDGCHISGLTPFSALMSEPPADIRDLVDKSRARQIVGLMSLVGFTAVPKTRMVGQYALDKTDPLGEGPRWVDVLASHPSLPGQRKRIRLYDLPADASPEAKVQIRRAAQREYLLTADLRHPGVVSPQDFIDDPQRGPALIFDYAPAAEPLETWLADHQMSLDLGARIGLVRQLAEVLQYAHGRRATHRALTPKQVYVEGGATGGVQVTIRDWQTGQVEEGTSHTSPRATALAGTRNLFDLAGTESVVWLAPEVFTASVPDGVALDVYGLGAVSYLIFTGQPPARSIAELEARVRSGVGGFNPADASDDIPPGLVGLVGDATHPDLISRTPTVAAFLDELAEVERELREQASHVEPDVVSDPLQAQPDDMVGPYLVHRRLGTGSTGVALLVISDEHEDVVLKVAHDARRATRLDDEAAVLRLLDSPLVVKLLRGPFDLGGRRCLLLDNAGLPTLGSRIRDEGRLTLEQLESYGADLFEAVAHLDERGVMHRDIKPDNLGVREDPGTRRRRVVLFDFSLSREALDHVKAGTPPYLDPFLGGVRRPRYDRAAERFAVAVTLFEMATGQLPTWGDGASDPATIPDGVNVASSMFEPGVADALVVFFRKALAREATQRFPDAAEMAEAWRDVFRQVDEVPASSVEQIDSARDAAADAATTDTPLAESGLTARAVSAVSRLDVRTVGELLAVPAFRISTLPGAGVNTKREIQRRMRSWRARLSAQTAEAARETELATEPGSTRGIEFTLNQLVPRSNGRNQTEIGITRLLLGLPTAATVDGRDVDGYVTEELWPTSNTIARLMGVSAGRVAQGLAALRPRWAKALAEEWRILGEVLESFEGIATLHELAAALIAMLGSSAEGNLRTRHAAGLVRVLVEQAQSAEGELSLVTRRPRDPTAAVLIALADRETVLDGETLLDVARLTADAVDELAQHSDPTPSSEALPRLRQVVPGGVDLTSMSSQRLLSLATSASRTAALSQRQEVYRRNLAPVESLRLVLRGGALVKSRLSVEGLRQRVLSRFPDAAPLPERPALDALVDAAGRMQWDGAHYTRLADSSQTLLKTGTTAFTVDYRARPAREADDRLRASLAARSWLTLGVRPAETERTVQWLHTRYGVTVFDLSATLVDELRQAANHYKIDWSLLLRADASDVGSADRNRLTRLVQETAHGFLTPLLASDEPLLLTDASALARYNALAPLVTQADLATVRPAARWLLLPRRSSDRAPMLDGRPVPAGAEGVLDLPAELSPALEPAS